jgi:hypothetical protein
MPTFEHFFGCGRYILGIRVQPEVRRVVCLGEGEMALRFLQHQGFLNTLIPILITGLLLVTAPAPLAAQQDAPPFRITVLEGQGSINNIKDTVNRAISVQVEDENRNALSGVSVTFFLPNDGPSGLFPNGSRVLTVFTDDKGVASSRSVRFNNLIGLMPVKVVASMFSQTTTATVTQTNVSSAATQKSSYVPAAGGSKIAPSGGGGPSKKFWIILAIAGAAAGAGIYFATRSSTPTAGVSLGTPSVGTPTVGPK